MKSIFRLIVHQKTYSDEDLLISQKDCPEAKPNDIVEIYHSPPDEGSQFEESPRLLLQIKNFRDDLRDTISVEQSIAQAFGLQSYKNVTVRFVRPADVALESIELTFKDQYMGRSEMWRLKNCLINTCVYINKKIEFCCGAVRCQVYEMWAQGDRVACGVITDDTKVVFRSSTAMIYIFLQMSTEMWDFDIYGDLYFEKAVNGFLADLFAKWKKNGSNHEVTIVLFSRTFYEANSLEEFPEHMRECLQKDYKGRYYEDFYRVAVQNERYDDWCGILVQLRRIFHYYLSTVLEYHKRPGISIPTACNSTASQGNFLEILNVSLNVFEKHYLDRSFDRTGQLSVVVTPGVGIFEVDRELTNITKQRIIDNGVGSDLVCVGEQPLHAVPLLKFHNKDTNLNVPDDYSMPHWINLSFYSTNKKIAYSSFVPRIKLPGLSLHKEDKKDKESPKNKLLLDDEYIHNSFFDYDAYDASVFQLPTVHHAPEPHSFHHTKIIPSRYKRSSGSLLDSDDFVKTRRKLSDPDILPHKTTLHIRSEPINIPPAVVSPIVSPHADDKDFSPHVRMVVGSEGSPPHESKALINPFDPSHVTIKLTSNRRRWTHIFPKGPTGVLIQQHHYQAVPTGKQDAAGEKDTLGCQSASVGKSFGAATALQEYCKKRPNTGHNMAVPSKNQTKSLILLWGATGEQEWTPALTTVNDVLIGVDWKSLTIPACLPITTDYFPDKRALHIDYVVSLYSLVPDSVNTDYAQQRASYKKPLSTYEVFRELISQRLAQGFQLILMNDNKDVPNGVPAITSVRRTVVPKNPTPSEECYFLSIGRLFHKISLSGNTISVTRYRPRHPYPGFNFQYRYRFHAPHHDTYEESYATFTTEKLEHYNWNHLDHYVCMSGDNSREVGLVEPLKYWRFRVYLLPLTNPATKKILEGSEFCNIYTVQTSADHQLMVEGLLKFIESAVNKIKRSVSKKPRMSLSIANIPPLVPPRRNSMSNFSMQNVGSNSPFRERLGSNRLPHRPRSGSKGMDKGRLSQGSQDSSSEMRDHNESTDENPPSIVTILKPDSTNLEIIEAFKHPLNGLPFINTYQNLPNLTFVTADAVSWLMTRMEGITNIGKAIEVMRRLHKDQLVRHASGDFKRKFAYGFCLFYIVTNEKEDKDSFQPSGDLENFENEFLEVEVKPPINWGRILAQDTENGENKSNFFDNFVDEDDNDDLECDKTEMFKRMRLETDVMGKSDRVEWGHAKYQTVFRPDQAYELVVEWLTSSGSIVAELLIGWHRKAQTCGLQMVPIPHDPLNLPFTSKSDPLRGPIFVPLNVKCLGENGQMFYDFLNDEEIQQLFLFQEAIIQRFGFIQSLLEPTVSNGNQARRHQYVHATGMIFILISSPLKSKTNIDFDSVITKHKIAERRFQPRPSPRLQESHITRHVSGKKKDDYDNSRKMGFLWSWNHMMSKKWRTNQGIDNNFLTKVLRDFREFCNNSNDRLRDFWFECWETKTKDAYTFSKEAPISIFK